MNLEKFLKNNSKKRYKSRLSIPEIIFHDQIHVKYIEKIICYSEPIYQHLLKNIPERYKHLITYGNLKNNIKHYTFLCNKDIIFSKKPNFCYFHQKDYNVGFIEKIHSILDKSSDFIENCRINSKFKKFL